MGTGIDYNRMTMLLAIAEKRLGLNLQNLDIYINAAGGLKITEPAADLAIITAVYSAVSGKPIPGDMAAIGETGLTGEIRNVNQTDKRISELAKMGFKRCIVPGGSKLEKKNGAELLFADNLADVIRLCFGGKKEGEA